MKLFIMLTPMVTLDFYSTKDSWFRNKYPSSHFLSDSAALNAGCKLSFIGDTLAEPVKQVFPTVKSTLTAINNKLECNSWHFDWCVQLISLPGGVDWFWGGVLFVVVFFVFFLLLNLCCVLRHSPMTSQSKPLHLVNARLMTSNPHLSVLANHNV